MSAEFPFVMVFRDSITKRIGVQPYRSRADAEFDLMLGMKGVILPAEAHSDFKRIQEAIASIPDDDPAR